MTARNQTGDQRTARTQAAARRARKTDKVHWADVEQYYTYTQDWGLVAASQGATVEELRSLYLEWPAHVAPTLEAWGARLDATVKIKKAARRVAQAEIGNARAEAQLQLAQLGLDKSLIECAPTCCPAARAFLTGATVDEAREIVGDFKCSDPAACFSKCGQIFKRLIQEQQLLKVLSGDTKTLAFLADAVLHQSTTSPETNRPLDIIFATEDDEQ